MYIAKYKDGGHAGEWTATGKQFQVPYVFKTLFSKEPIEFDDFCETFEVQTALYLDMNEDTPEDHDYRFIGKVGRFCPIKPGCNGGELLRQKIDGEGNTKYDAATGSKGYRWLESELVKEFRKEDDIDKSYYTKLVDDAIYGSGTGKNRKPGISDFGDFEWFVSDEPYVNEKKEDEAEPWEIPCRNKERTTCIGCKYLYKDDFHTDCELGLDISDLLFFEKERNEQK